MKFICSKDDIVKAVTYAESVISQKSTHSILQNLLLEASDGRVQITSTDLEVGFITSIPATIEIEGDITVYAKKLLELVRKFNPCNLIFQLEENNKIVIYSNDPGIKAVVHINGVPRIDFPEIPKPVTEKYFELPQKYFKMMLKKTLHAISNEETRYFLNGCYFQKEANFLKLVSTDGRRLSYIHKDYPINEPDFGVIIPKKILNELLRILGDEGNIKIAVGEKQIFFDFNNVYFVSNLIDGTFPNYKQVIPDSYEIRLTLDTQEFLTKIERVSPMADTKSSQIVIRLRENLLMLTAQNVDLGNAEDELEIEYSGPEMDIALNFQYLLDSVKEVEEVKLNLDIISPNNPTLIKGVGNMEYLAIIMPMKITS
jgi:DNA polymerase-3 subunit beta